MFIRRLLSVEDIGRGAHPLLCRQRMRTVISYPRTLFQVVDVDSAIDGYAKALDYLHTAGNIILEGVPDHLDIVFRSHRLKVRGILRNILGREDLSPLMVAIKSLAEKLRQVQEGVFGSLVRPVLKVAVAFLPVLFLLLRKN